MSEHDDIEQWLPAYVLGALEPVEVVHLEAHLVVCDGCRTEVARLRRMTDQLLRDVPRQQPPPSLRDRILGIDLGDVAEARATRDRLMGQLARWARMRASTAVDCAHGARRGIPAARLRPGPRLERPAFRAAPA